MERSSDNQSEVRIYRWSEYNWIGIIAGFFLVDLLKEIDRSATIPRPIEFTIFGVLIFLMIVYTVIHSRVPIWQAFGGLNVGLWAMWTGDPALTKGLHFAITEIFFVLLTVSAICTLIARRRSANVDIETEKVLLKSSLKALATAFILNGANFVLSTCARRWSFLYVGLGFTTILTWFFSYGNTLYARYVLAFRLSRDKAEQISMFDRIP